jgi:hypothetical protein
MTSQLNYLIAEQRRIDFGNRAEQAASRAKHVPPGRRIRDAGSSSTRKEPPMSPYLYARLMREKLVALRARASAAR